MGLFSSKLTLRGSGGLILAGIQMRSPEGSAPEPKPNSQMINTCGRASGNSDVIPGYVGIMFPLIIP